MAEDRKLNDDQVQKLQTNIIDRYDSIKKQVVALQHNLDTLQANWRGVGAAGFDKKQREIMNHMEAIGRLLERFLDNIGLTRKDKDNLEEDIRATMHAIQVEGAKASALNLY